MILRVKLEKLNDDELELLYHIVENNAIYRIEPTVQEYCWLNLRWIYNRIQEYKQKIKSEYADILASLEQKLF